MSGNDITGTIITQQHPTKLPIKNTVGFCTKNCSFSRIFILEQIVSIFKTTNDCQMGQFLLRKENSPELQSFAHIEEFALKKNNSIRLNSFNEACSQHLRLYYIVDGKFDWLINGETYTLYPTDLAV